MTSSPPDDFKLDSSIDKSKRKRLTFTSAQKRELEAIFARNLYPSREEVDNLVAQFPELTIKQIRIYFQNRRAAIRAQSRNGFGTQMASPEERLDDSGSQSPRIQTETAISTVPSATFRPSDDHTDSVFAEALQTSNLSTLQLLLKQGYDPNKQLATNGEFPLLFASRVGDAASLQLLLQFGAQISIRNSESFTALHMAILHGRTESVKLLAKQRLCLNDTDAYGRTAVHLAVERNDQHMLYYLIESGSNVDSTDFVGYAPLHVAVWNGNANLVMMLMVAGAVADRRSAIGRITPYEMASMTRTPNSAQIQQLFKIYLDSRRSTCPAPKQESSSTPQDFLTQMLRGTEPVESHSIDFLVEGL